MRFFKRCLLLLVSFHSFLGFCAVDEASIQKDLDNYLEKNKDVASLFDAQEFRTPLHKKILESIVKEGQDFQIQLKQVEKFVDNLQKKARAALLLNAVRVSPKQFPNIYDLGQRAAKTLGLGPKINIFIVSSPEINAFTYSYNHEDFDIVLHSGLVDQLPENGLLAVISHEMGHVKDQAILYSVLLSAEFEGSEEAKSGDETTVVNFYNSIYAKFPPAIRKLFRNISKQMAEDGISGLSVTTDRMAEFTRQCETTADRAAVLVAGPEATLDSLALLAYGSEQLSKNFNVDELIEQIREVLSENVEPEDINKILDLRGSHPFDVLRLIEARDYSKTTDYQKLKNKLDQSSYGKELDLFVNLSSKLERLKQDSETYQSNRADFDDPLVRLSRVDRYKKLINSHNSALAELMNTLIKQIRESDLAEASNALFNLLLDKIKSDRTNKLRNGFAPLLVTALKNRGSTDQEILNKIELLEKLIRPFEDLDKAAPDRDHSPPPDGMKMQLLG
ncbi:MAG: M48 family metallopeptidase [Bacteriovoracia bacterium]